LDGVTLTVNSLDFLEYRKMTLGNKEQFDLMKKAISKVAKIFKEKTTLNVVVTKANFNSINKILRLSKKLRINVKLLELTNGKQLKKIYVPFNEIIKKFKGDNIEYVNSCCPSNNCSLCKKLYPVVRLSPDGKINGCIMNENGEIDILKQIKARNTRYLKQIIINKIYEKRDNHCKRN